MSGDYYCYEYGLLAASDGRGLIRGRQQPKIALADVTHEATTTIEEPPCP